MKLLTTRKSALLLVTLIATYMGYRLVITWIEKTTFDCSQPPEGVIRFTLSAGGDDARLYEWHGTAFHEVGTTPKGQKTVAPYAPGSYYNPYSVNVPGVYHQADDPGSVLTTPFAISPDAKRLVAGLGPEFNFPERIAFQNLGASQITGTVNFHEAINAVAWDPSSKSAVVLSHTERYGLNPLALLSATKKPPSASGTMSISAVAFDEEHNFPIPKI
jgi:hypothetical protein